jgi:hypothetical protein
MKNIHVLPTDKPSNGYILGKCIKELSDVKIGQFTKTYYLMFDKEYFQPHNIYITSDEEIKEGDWVLGDFPDNPIGKVISKYGQEFTAQSLNGDKYGLAEYDSKKIILTTDSQVIKDGVQAIDDEFLEWFVKNPSCEEAEVESKIIKDGVWTDLKGYVELPTIHSINYKIIIPKEEPKQDAINYSLNAFKVPKEYFGKEEPKQETLEEAAERLANTTDEFNMFIAGAKWQQKKDTKELKPNPLLMDEVGHWDFRRQRSYSEEDMKQAFEDGQENMDYSEMYGWSSKLTTKNWFEKFKKK